MAPLLVLELLRALMLENGTQSVREQRSWARVESVFPSAEIEGGKGMAKIEHVVIIASGRTARLTTTSARSLEPKRHRERGPDRSARRKGGP